MLEISSVTMTSIVANFFTKPKVKALDVDLVEKQ